MKSSTGLMLSLAMLSSLLGAPARAQQVEVNIGQSLICDTQQQVERFLTVFDGNAEIAAATVNAEAKDPSACVIATVAYVVGPEVGTTRNRSGTFNIVRILVLGVVTEAGLQAVIPAPFYSITKVEERDA
jgi:hypothetical protein